MSKNNYFCSRIADVQTMEEDITIKQWIEDLPKKGRITFSLDELKEQFPHKQGATIKSSLVRLVRKNKVQTIWHKYYIVIPDEYGLKGVVPPIVYIDQLMKYLGREYYVGLLNAAALHGSAHQQPQEFTVITNTSNLRNTLKKGVKINFVAKKNIPSLYLKQIITKTGYVNISSPELTAIDLIQYVSAVGGINRVSTVLNELAEVMDFREIGKDFFEYTLSPVIQRLGYILDKELGFEELANTLFEKANDAGLSFRNVPLKTGKKDEILYSKAVDKKWKIIINEEIEIDDDT
ncbi:hypothetical protein EZS27_008170 [termite gut metagenome]|uniref:AbiEi antitoxin C-terminal domain-containing protein n=1 Tax=termite gut metagenome TaxID=433724 RepID=A0A5J4SDH5_9ZZZZ